MSQAQFAAEADVSASALANWEQGRQRPSFKAAEKISDAFNLTLDYLYLGRVWTLRHDIAEAIRASEASLQGQAGFNGAEDDVDDASAADAADLALDRESSENPR